jgi:hypothetical protein
MLSCDKQRHLHVTEPTTPEGGQGSREPGGPPTGQLPDPERRKLAKPQGLIEVRVSS